MKLQFLWLATIWNLLLPAYELVLASEDFNDVCSSKLESKKSQDQYQALAEFLKSTKARGVFLSSDEIKILIQNTFGRINIRNAIFISEYHKVLLRAQSHANANNGISFLSRKELNILRKSLPLISGSIDLPPERLSDPNFAFRINPYSIILRDRAPGVLSELLKDIQTSCIPIDNLSRLEDYIYKWQSKQNSANTQDYVAANRTATQSAEFFGIKKIKYLFEESHDFFTGKLETFTVGYGPEQYIPWFQISFQNQAEHRNQKYDFKVYLNAPLGLWRGLLPKIASAAEIAGAHAMKFGAIPKTLNRPDRIVVYFNDLKSAVRFAQLTSNYFNENHITAPHPTFTVPVGNSGVSIGFDLANIESWRGIISAVLSRAIVECGASDLSCIREKIQQAKIDPNTLVPLELLPELESLIHFLQ